MVFERLSPVEVSIAVHAAKFFATCTNRPIARVVVNPDSSAIDTMSIMGEEVAFQLVRTGELTHATEMSAKRTLESFGEIVDEHVPAQTVLALETCWTVLQVNKILADFIYNTWFK